MSKRYDDPIEVDPAPSAAPAIFKWRSRVYVVEKVIKHWREAAEGWDPARRREFEFYRVEAEGGIYDLRLDSSGRGRPPSWRLARVWD